MTGPLEQLLRPNRAGRLLKVKQGVFAHYSALAKDVCARQRMCTLQRVTIITLLVENTVTL